MGRVSRSLNISHADALRLARHAGSLVRSLHGRPYLVIGIERGGTAIARAFAEGAQATNSILVTSRRPSSRGWRGRARMAIRRATPRALRKIYKRLFFRSLARATRLVTNGEPLAASEIDRLAPALAADSSKFIVVVDDAIDSGGTASSVLTAVNGLAPHHRVALFTLTTTSGGRVHADQLNVFADIVEYVEGDIADLARSHRESAEWSGRLVFSCEDNEWPGQSGPVGQTARLNQLKQRAQREQRAQPERPLQRSLYLDLDGTLVPNSFRTAYAVLCRGQFLTGSWRSLLRLATARIARKLRLIHHRALSRVLDREITALDPMQAESFQSRLASKLACDCRWSLATIARSPNVRCGIVTAALAAYAPAIERAFGIPILTGSGPNADGNWVEVVASHKIDAIRRHGSLVSDEFDNRTLLMGDTITDALSVAGGIEVAIVPTWDKTGILTLLGAESWWSGKRRSEHQATRIDIAEAQ